MRKLWASSRRRKRRGPLSDPAYRFQRAASGFLMTSVASAHSSFSTDDNCVKGQVLVLSGSNENAHLKLAKFSLSSRKRLIIVFYSCGDLQCERLKVKSAVAQ